MIEALENSQQNQQAGFLDVDPEVEAFVNGITYSLQKTNSQQRECLFINIRQLIYDTLFPRCLTAPRPSHISAGAEPHVAAFRPPRPVTGPSVPTAHGDQNQYSCNWVPNAPIDSEASREFSHTLQFTKL